MTHRGYTYVRASGPAPGSAAYFGQGQTAPAAQPAASGYAHGATPAAAREEASAAATPLASSGLGFLPGSPQYRGEMPPPAAAPPVVAAYAAAPPRATGSAGPTAYGPGVEAMQPRATGNPPGGRDYFGYAESSRSVLAANGAE